MALKDIVKVTISRETTAVARASFGIPCVIGQFADNKLAGSGLASFGRAQEYATLADMAAAGWTSSDAEYKAAAGIFRNNPTVTKVVIGRKDSADADWAAAIAAVQVVNDTWYGLVAVTSTDAEVLEIAAYIETAKKVFFVQVTAPGAIDPASTTDLASALQDLGYDRTITIYHLAANAGERADATWLGEGLPFDPGSSTWAYKQLSGVTVDALNTTQRSAALAKNCNIYTTTAGVAITEQGKVVGGEYIDIIIGVDYLEARLMENVYQTLVNARKVPYDDGGITAISGIVQGTLEEAARAGILQLDSIKLTVPKYATISTGDKLARKLPDIKFTALLLGAIHSVEISGTVSV